jgi:hypothetical protein
MSSFEKAVAANEEYFELEGVELKREIRCAGCDDNLEFGSDYAAHSAKCEYAIATLEPGDEITYEVDESDLLQQYYEDQDDDQDDDHAYEAYKEWRRER